jgi:alkylhydroperoxidase family enzyme
VLTDHRTAPISPAEHALFAFLEQVNGPESHRLTQADVDPVLTAGWSQEAVYDAVTVCALFNFYNAWIDGTGVGDMPAAAYEASGQRLATMGYLPPEPPAP